MGLRIRLSVGGTKVKLFAPAYVPGSGVPAGASFARALEASYLTQTGLVAFVAPGVMRESHYVGGVRTLLLEPSARNLCPNSNPNNAAWQSFLSLNQGPVIGADGVAATGIQNHQNTVTDGSAWYQNVAFPLGSYWHSSFAKDGVDGHRYFRHSQSSAAIAVYGPDHLTTAAWLRYSAKLTNADAANVNLGWRGAVTGGNNLSRQFFGYQMEDAAVSIVPTSYIRTAGAALTRPIDDLQYPAGGTLYEKYYDDLGVLQESIRVYVANTTLAPARPRAYVSLKLGLGVYTLAQMRLALV